MQAAKPITAPVSAQMGSPLSPQQRVADAAQGELAERRGAAAPASEALGDQHGRLAALVRLEVERVEALAVDHRLALVADDHAAHPAAQAGHGRTRLGAPLD